MIDVQNMCYRCMSKTVNGVCTKCGFENEKYMPSPHQLKPGTVLNGKYILGSCIGEGGFGITYVGYDLNLDMKVAIKEHFPNGMVMRDISDSDSVSVYSQGNKEKYNIGKDKFIKEAKALAKCENLPGVVSVKDFFNENGTAYIVMEFIEGESLKNYLKRHGDKMDPEQVISMMQPLIESLSQVHSYGIIHRDISPDNIMITDTGEVKLIDFGAAREVSADAQKSLSIMLKPGYAPEEQYRTHGEQGPWTDVYALCATMYRAITGKTPVESLERLMNDSLQSPSAMGIDIPYNYENAIMKGMAVSKAQRFQNMQFLHNVLYSNDATVALDEDYSWNGSDEYWQNPQVQQPQRPQHNSMGLVILLGIIIMMLIGVLTFVTMMVIERITNADTTENVEPTETVEVIEEHIPPVFDKVSASSTRGVDTSTGVAYNYPIEYINDGNMSTAWSSNRNIEITPTVRFSADKEQNVTGVKMTNGYCKTSETYYKNRRITKVEIIHDKGKEIFKLEADAFGKMQKLRFNEPVDTKTIEVHVLESIQGTWKDIAISEIEIY